MQPLVLKILAGVLVLLALFPVLRRYFRIDPGGTVWAICLTAGYVLLFGLLLVLMLPYTGQGSTDAQRTAAAAVLLGCMGSGLVWLTQLIRGPRFKAPAYLRAPTTWFSLAAHGTLIAGIAGLVLTR